MAASGEYITDDLGLASLLYASGVRYKGLRVKEGTWRKEMVFEHPPTELVAGWQSGSAVVDALAFWRASRTLKHDLMNNRTP